MPGPILPSTPGESRAWPNSETSPFESAALQGGGADPMRRHWRWRNRGGSPSPRRGTARAGCAAATAPVATTTQKAKVAPVYAVRATRAIVLSSLADDAHIAENPPRKSRTCRRKAGSRGTDSGKRGADRRSDVRSGRRIGAATLQPSQPPPAAAYFTTGQRTIFP